MATPAPSASPTAKPTAKPTGRPTKSPTASPTTKPTAKPTKSPTASPTFKPTGRPTKSPSTAPTGRPTLPTAHPTFSPTTSPTFQPSGSPTHYPVIPLTTVFASIFSTVFMAGVLLQSFVLFLVVMGWIDPRWVTRSVQPSLQGKVAGVKRLEPNRWYMAYDGLLLLGLAITWSLTIGKAAEKWPAPGRLNEDVLLSAFSEACIGTVFMVANMGYMYGYGPKGAED